MDGLDVITSKLDSVAAEEAIKAIGNDEHSTIGHGDLNADLAATLEKVAGTLIQDALRV